MSARGRGDRLTLDEVKDILMAEGTASDIAARFGVTALSVQLHKRGGFRRITDNALRELHDEGKVPPPWNPVGRGVRWFTDEEVAAIRASSETSVAEAERYGCAPSTIRMLRTGRTYRGRGES